MNQQQQLLIKRFMGYFQILSDIVEKNQLFKKN